MSTLGMNHVNVTYRSSTEEEEEEESPTQLPGFINAKDEHLQILHRGIDPVHFDPTQLSSISSSSQPSPRTNSRNLFLFGTATGSICSLTSDVFYFIQDPVTQLYYWNGDKNNTRYSEIDSIWSSTVLERWNVTNDDNSKNGTSIAVRACLCTQYLTRPIEFCSAEYFSCSVRTTPIQCFTLSSTDVFIQSFWPVLIFWMLVVVYVWSCSDPGRIARQYVQRVCRGGHRRCRLPRTTSNSTTDHQMLEQQLDSIVEHYPSRANFMYREAVNRQNRQERYEQIRQNLFWYRTYQRMKRSFLNCICCNRATVAATDNNIHDSDSNEMPVVDMTTGEESPITTEPSGPRLLLKTKVYYSDDEAVTSATDTRRKEHSSQQQRTTLAIGSELNQFDVEDGINSHNHGDESRCAICLLPLQDGIDIIGDLPCHHCMHKQCLKEWLMRKNRCPLCQLSDVATYQNATHHTITTTTINGTR